jgi:hypothetical protein
VILPVQMGIDLLSSGANATYRVLYQSRGALEDSRSSPPVSQDHPPCASPSTRTPSDGEVNEPEPARQPTLLTSPVNFDDEGMSEDQRWMANLGKKMAKKGAKKPVLEAKASAPRKGQESPETKVSTPIVTRQRASGAGGLGSGGVSGQTGTCVASGSPPKT